MSGRDVPTHPCATELEIRGRTLSRRSAKPTEAGHPDLQWHKKRRGSPKESKLQRPLNAANVLFRRKTNMLGGWQTKHSSERPHRSQCFRTAACQLSACQLYIPNVGKCRSGSLHRRPRAPNSGCRIANARFKLQSSWSHEGAGMFSSIVMFPPVMAGTSPTDCLSQASVNLQLQVAWQHWYPVAESGTLDI